MIVSPRHILLHATLPLALLLAPATPARSAAPVNKHLYSETADPKADIAAAVNTARRERKRILLEFGGNWCSDCLVLDYNYHQPPNDDLLARHFILVHVDIGHMDRNLDVVDKYHVPIAHGVPALAVLDSNGKLLYAEREKEFEHTTPASITAFLNRWKS